MLQDLRFALRLFKRHPGHALIGALTLALGVGANSAVFSIADSVLFRPLPFPAADRLFALRLADPATGVVYGTLPASAVDAAHATGVFDAVASVSPRTSRAYFRTPDALEALSFSPASREYLDLLGVRPELGRSFDPSDAGTYAVVLTHEAWMQRYGGNPGVIGTVVPAIVRSTERAPVSQPSVRIGGVLA